MPYKKQKAIRSTKKDGIYDLMTDLGLILFGSLVTAEHTKSTPKVFIQTLGVLLRIVTKKAIYGLMTDLGLCCFLSCQDRLQ